MADGDYHVFLSHSRNDPVATADVLVQLHRCGLDVFKDDESIKPSDEWLVRLQAVLEGAAPSSCWSGAMGWDAGSAPRRR
ncbi:MAG: hypothetical protein U1E38_08705 [Rhodospirillales bacterium]